MHQTLRTFSVLSITMAIALKLFAFGLSFSMTQRVAGDAYQYLSVANQFDSFESVWNYAGVRSVGLPFVEFTIKQGLLAFTSTDNLSIWVDAICTTLLVIHIATVWFFSGWARKTHIIDSEGGFLFLFAFLGTYPAFIGHTTLPLTDTLAVDLVLCGFMTLEAAFRQKRLLLVSILSGLSALFFAGLLLVRPGSLAALGAALTLGGAISLRGERRKTALIGIAALGCLALTAPFVSNCAQKYGGFCLQSMVPSFPQDAQAGLMGARTLWARGYTDTGVIRTLPDETMVANFSSKCQLTTLLGFDVSSLTGCLLAQPLAIPAYVGKKWIGLFDHFRFTPFLETQTPFWLRWLSRAYDSLSWIGFALFLLSLITVAKQHSRERLMSLLADNITPTLLTAYSLLILAQHTIMHVEERYGLPLIPLCATVLVIYGERAIHKFPSFQRRTNGMLLLYCFLAWGIFIGQIIVWDNTV
jgi:hypothetical protein